MNHPHITFTTAIFLDITWNRQNEMYEKGCDIKTTHNRNYSQL